MVLPDTISEYTKQLADEGKLVEAGFNAMRELILSPDCSAAQLNDMQLAYMAGAQHLWASVMMMLGTEAEPTANDLSRMGKIQAELDTWAETINLRYIKGQGGEH